MLKALVALFMIMAATPATYAKDKAYVGQKSGIYWMSVSDFLGNRFVKCQYVVKLFRNTNTGKLEHYQTHACDEKSAELPDPAMPLDSTPINMSGVREATHARINPKNGFIELY